MEDGEQLAQDAVERLSEDETLRGDLTDDGFGPLLQWATAEVIGYAKKLAAAKTAQPETALDNYAARLKQVIQAVVAAADAGKIEDTAELLNFDLDAEQHDKLQEQLVKLSLEKDAADDNAIKISAVLAQAL